MSLALFLECIFKHYQKKNRIQWFKPRKPNFHYLFYDKWYFNSLILTLLMSTSLVLPHIQSNILISVTLILFSCWFFTAQHSVPYNITDLTVVKRF